MKKSAVCKHDLDRWTESSIWSVEKASVNRNYEFSCLVVWEDMTLMKMK
jgi:hypothetical protein